MKLLQVLLTQPQGELVKRVNNLGLSCNTRSRQQLTEALTKNLLDKEIVHKVWEELNNKEKHLLLQMCYSPSVMAISPQELRTCLKREDREDFWSILTNLKGKGFVYEDELNNVILPQEIKEAVHNIIQHDWSDDCIFVPLRKKVEYTIIHDIFEFMDIISSKRIHLTKNKTIYKKDLNFILTHLNIPEQIPTEQWRFGYGRHFNAYPDYFSFLYDFCFERGWILEDDTLKIGEKWEKGQMQPINELLDGMHRFYLRLYKRPIPQLPFVLELLEKILRDGDAIERTRLIERIKVFVDPYYYDKPENIVDKRIIKMLLYTHFLSQKEIDDSYYVYLTPRS